MEKDPEYLNISAVADVDSTKSKLDQVRSIQFLGSASEFPEKFEFHE